MEQIADLIMKARKLDCSDIHISEGMPMKLRIDGELRPAPFNISEDDMRDLILQLLTPPQKPALMRGEDVDAAMQTPDGNRQRINIFQQRGCLAATIRLLNNRIPTLDELGLPQVLKTLAGLPRGFVLVTGPTGSGKSTTLASMIEYINESKSRHIITIEDPIEYTYRCKKSLIHQREIGIDVGNFSDALRSALREDPDVILVGEMRDYETISAALTAAETGHLVFSTLHTTGAAQTIDRIIDACPAGIQNQIRTQLSSVLRGVITQCLVPCAVGYGRVAATEVMINNDAISHMIRENKCHQIQGAMQASALQGMHTLNGDLSRLVRQRNITREHANEFSNDLKELQMLLG